MLFQLSCSVYRSLRTWLPHIILPSVVISCAMLVFFHTRVPIRTSSSFKRRRSGQWNGLLMYFMFVYSWKWMGPNRESVQVAVVDYFLSLGISLCDPLFGGQNWWSRIIKQIGLPGFLGDILYEHVWWIQSDTCGGSWGNYHACFVKSLDKIWNSLSSLWVSSHLSFLLSLMVFVVQTITMSAWAISLG